MQHCPAVGRIWAGCAALTVLAAAPIGAAAPAYADTEAVSVEDGSPEFSPGRLTVRVGDTVRWSNTSLINAHNVSSSRGGWSFGADLAPLLSPGSSSASFTFTSAGSYSYVCRFHPGMGGAVVVTGGGPKPAPSSPPTPTSAPKPTPTRSPSAAPTAASPTRAITSPPASPQRPSAAAAKPPASRRPRPAAARRPTSRRGLLRGLTAADPTGRERGLPALVALTMVVGVGSAHVRVRRLLPVANGRHRLSPDRSRRRRSVGRRT
jgi:plastocyanin